MFALEAFNCDTLTASVGSVPGATPLIWLLPLCNPSLVKDTGPAFGLLGFALPGVIVIPLPFVTVVLPAASLNVADFISVSSGLTA